MKHHLVLVGLPGSGKSTVGPLAATLLDTFFSDLDTLVVFTAGMPVTEIFSRSGEAHFRILERSAMDGTLAAPPHVISPGAGWIAEPGNLEAARRAGALLAYLEVDPAVAASRLGGASSERPLLAGGEALSRVRELLARREAWYRRADLVVDGSDTPEAVAALVVKQFREATGPGR